MFGESTRAVKRSTWTLLEACKEVSLEVNTLKTKYMVMSRHQNARKKITIY
jgi:hypothetical protein